MQDSTLLDIENEYVTWLHSNEKRKEINCRIDSTDVKIIFNRGRLIYPFSCMDSEWIYNTINITSDDNNKIKSLFKKYLLKPPFKKVGEYYVFPKEEYNWFKMRFFANESFITEKFEGEEEKYASYENPECKGCALI